MIISARSTCPEKLEPALVYHILGNRQTYPDFAVWEEDYLEFLCGMIGHHAQLERLFLLLKTRYLLLLGAPFADWLVRFFLFVVKGGRFSDHRKEDVQTYLTDRAENLGEPLIFFFDRVVGTTRIIRGDPGTFTCELALRWRAEYQNAAADEDVFAQISEEMPRGAVFVSYSRDDIRSRPAAGAGSSRRPGASVVGQTASPGRGKLRAQPGVCSQERMQLFPLDRLARNGDRSGALRPPGAPLGGPAPRGGFCLLHSGDHRRDGSAHGGTGRVFEDSFRAALRGQHLQRPSPRGCGSLWRNTGSPASPGPRGDGSDWRRRTER